MSESMPTPARPTEAPTADFTTIEKALEALQQGRFIVVVDDEDRENEGDLIMAAGKATPEQIAFMVRHTSGVICVPMPGDRLDALDLGPMVERNTEAHRTAFTVSVDYVHDTGTGISAADRAKTIRALADDKNRVNDFARPGHIFPLRARDGGVLRRAGHTEAAVDLCRAAGLDPVGCICELVNDDGSMQRLPELRRFAAEYDMPLITIADLIAWRRRKETLVERLGETTIETRHGTFTAIEYRSLLDDLQSVALIKGEITDTTVPLVRVHAENVLADVFDGDCGRHVLDAALAAIGQADAGVLVYLRNGLGHPVIGDARDTAWREHGLGSQILTDLGVRRLKVLSRSTRRYAALQGHGLEVVGQVHLKTGEAEG